MMLHLVVLVIYLFTFMIHTGLKSWHRGGWQTMGGS